MDRNLTVGSSAVLMDIAERSSFAANFLNTPDEYCAENWLVEEVVGIILWKQAYLDSLCAPGKIE